MHTAETIYSRLRFYKKLTSLDSILFTAWRLDQLELLQIKKTYWPILVDCISNGSWVYRLELYMILERLKVDNLLTASLIALENLSHNRKYCGSQKSKYITDKSIRLYLNSINGSIDI